MKPTTSASTSLDSPTAGSSIAGSSMVVESIGPGNDVLLRVGRSVGDRDALGGDPAAPDAEAVAIDRLDVEILRPAAQPVAAGLGRRFLGHPQSGHPGIWIGIEGG